MKTNPATLLTMGRTLDRVKDRSGVYKLPSGNGIPRFGTAGRQKAATPSAVQASALATQPTLFEKLEVPAETKALKPVEPAQPPVARVVATPAQIPGLKPSPQAGFTVFWVELWRGFFGSVGQWFKFSSRSSIVDARPRAQAELALEKVTVIRNDLSEADVVVVAVERKKENAQEPSSDAAPKPWKRLTARWGKRNVQTAMDAGQPSERPAELVPAQP